MLGTYRSPLRVKLFNTYSDPGSVVEGEEKQKSRHLLSRWLSFVSPPIVADVSMGSKTN